MPDNQNPQQPTPPPPPPPKSGQQTPAPAPAPEISPAHVPMSEEFDRAKWTLPPMVPVAIAAAAVLVILAVVSFTNRQKPVMSGAITKVASADQEGNTMVAVQVKINNVVDRQLWVKNIAAELETADGKKFTDQAAPSGDVQRYLQAFPALADAKADPLHEELKIPPKTGYTGVAIFSYPVDQNAFAGRKSITLHIQLYDQPTLVLKNP